MKNLALILLVSISIILPSKNIWAESAAAPSEVEAEPIKVTPQATPEVNAEPIKVTTDPAAEQEAATDAPNLGLEPPPELGAPLSADEAGVQMPSDSASPKEDEETKIIKAIEVKGNKTIGIATILAKIKIRVGEPYRQNVVSDDVKRLYNTGYFSDVSVDRPDHEGGFKVIIYLTEKPIIEKITFSKTRHFNPKALQNKMKTKEGKFLDNKILKDDVKTIEELYAKKGLTSVKVDVETNVDETTGKATLHFVVQEGYRVKIKRIAVAGNKAFRYKKIIQTIKTRPAWLFNSGYLKENVLDEDIERIESFYEKEGFIDAKANYDIEDLSPGRIKVNITIDEGTRYYVGSIAVEGASVLSQSDILGSMKEIKEGKVFSRAKLDLDLANIRTLYFDHGYIFADVQEATSLNPDNGKVEIKLTMSEGGLAYVNKVRIEGNARTRDIVIRREIRLAPGDQFDGTKLRRSKERLKNLGYFQDVSYDIEDTDQPDQKDLVVQVKEAKTGSFSFGGGYSTVDQVVGFVEVEQKNFDFTSWPTFTGGGQNLSLRAETGSFRSNTRLSFTEPWLFDYPIAGGFDAYQSNRDRERDIGYGYDETRTGGDIRFSKELIEYVTAGIMYKREKIKIGNLEEGATQELAREVGENTVSSVGLNLALDTRDSIYNPTKGLYVSNGIDVAGGGLGGDKDFSRLHTLASYDIPLKFDSVLEIRARGGVVKAYGDTDGVPIFERFFAGGARTIRGYNERKVGPIDAVTEDPIGGESLLVGNIEYTVPLIDFIKLAGFFDTGNVWSKVRDIGSGGFKSGAGVGVRVKTPIGPISLDYGYPLADEPGEEDRSGKFYFSVSRGF